MKKLPQLLLLYSLIPLIPAAARAAEKVSPRLSLAQVSETALAQNPAVAEVRQNWEAMKARVPQATAWDDLRITANTRVARFVAIAPNGFMDQSLAAEQTIPLTGKNRTRGRIAEADAAAAFEELRRRESDVLAQTRTAFFRLANNYAQAEFNARNAASLRQIAEVMRSRFGSGLESASDTFGAEIEASKLLEAQRDFEQKIAAEQSALNVLLNRDAFAPLARAEEIVPRDMSLPAERELRALLFTQRPEIRRAEAKVAAEQNRVALARREWFPDPAVSVQGQRYNGASQAISELDAGISFTMPWVNPRKYSAGVREAASGLAAAHSALAAERSAALGRLRDALQNVETAHHHVELFRDRLLPQAQQAFESNQLSYATGGSSFTAWIGAQRSLRDIEAMAREHRAQELVALAELEAVVGAPLHIFPEPNAANKK